MPGIEVQASSELSKFVGNSSSIARRGRCDIKSENEPTHDLTADVLGQGGAQHEQHKDAR